MSGNPPSDLIVSSTKNINKGIVYLLRHEQRGYSISFDTTLTNSGLERAETIITPQLESRSIDIIYSSPFVRTLQTVRPFCEKTGLKVNLEWSLVESIPFNPIIPDEFTTIINLNYSSFLPYTQTLTDDMIDFNVLKLRIKRFIESLDRSKNILLVTHMPVINAVLSYKGFEYIEMYTHHQPGTLLSMSGDRF
jgi:2,3-bisphosphoglycerate-dependent phosphoglycerate mutase